MSASPNFAAVLADAILLAHFAWVTFVVLGLGLIWWGGWRHWRWVRNRWFRLAHLVAIGIVTLEALGGMVCPLTAWENELRQAAGGGAPYPGSFVQHWVHRLIFYEASERTFTVVYVLFFAAVALSFWGVPPLWRPPRRCSQPRRAGPDGAGSEPFRRF